jgi:hypothetical protein
MKDGFVIQTLLPCKVPSYNAEENCNAFNSNELFIICSSAKASSEIEES